MIGVKAAPSQLLLYAFPPLIYPHPPHPPMRRSAQRPSPAVVQFPPGLLRRGR